MAPSGCRRREATVSLYNICKVYAVAMQATLQLKVSYYVVINSPEFGAKWSQAIFLQTKSRMVHCKFPIPVEPWDLLMRPLEGGNVGLEWNCDKKKEILKVTSEGLQHLDYIFGISTPPFHNWKVRVFVLHSQTIIDQMCFTYDLEKRILQVEAHHTFN